MKFSTAVLASLVLAALGAPAARAQFLYNEQTQGDFSDDRFAPTPLAVAAGDNFLFGIVGQAAGAPTIDLDYFSVTVPPGLQLDHLILDLYDSADPQAFLAILPGPTFPIDPDTADPAELMGWVHMGGIWVGQDLLPPMAANGYGLTAPLPAGTYSFWAQQLDDHTDWTVNFQVSAVPSPSSGSLVICALSGAWLGRRRR